jgi:hypothetical protein
MPPYMDRASKPTRAGLSVWYQSDRGTRSGVSSTQRAMGSKTAWEPHAGRSAGLQCHRRPRSVPQRLGRQRPFSTTTGGTRLQSRKAIVKLVSPASSLQREHSCKIVSSDLSIHALNASFPRFGAAQTLSFGAPRGHTACCRPERHEG